MKDWEKTTESESNHSHLEKKSVNELLKGVNEEDKSVANSVEKLIPKIEALIDAALLNMQNGGRLFYIGSGTSGRLGIVDASECPPTYGVEHGVVIGIIAGGDGAIRKSVEFAEDDTEQGWKDLLSHKINNNDIVIGISASGTTPYVNGAIQKCNEQNILTGGITCNENSPLAQLAQYPIEVVVGPEFVTGSTRMKAGTAQKLILNMISTTLMIKLGKVLGNKMVDMQLSNNKLIVRGTKMVMEKLNVGYEKANELLLKHGSVRKVLKNEDGN